MADNGQTPAKPKNKAKHGHRDYSRTIKEKIELAVFLQRKGTFTDEEVASILQCSPTSVQNWKHSPEFARRYQAAKDRVDDRVEKSLFARACGLKVREVHEEALKSKGKIIRGAFVVRTVTKWLPPDPTACIFWLKNRRRAQWRDNPDFEKPVKKYVVQWGEDEPRDTDSTHPLQAIS